MGELTITSLQEHAAHAAEDSPAPKELISDEHKNILELVSVPADSKGSSRTATTKDIAPKGVMVEQTLVSNLEHLSELQLLPSSEPKPLKTCDAARKEEPEVSIEIKQPQILCVDDNPINLKILQAYLKKLGKKNVTCAENGLEAFKAIETTGTPFDIIFMDLSMPVCDGFESTARIRKLEKQRAKLHHPFGTISSFIIALTDQASSRDQDQAFASGVDKFVTKPMSLSQLKVLLNESEAAERLRSHESDSEDTQ